VKVDKGSVGHSIGFSIRTSAGWDIDGKTGRTR
jgi:hypothetical protein